MKHHPFTTAALLAFLSTAPLVTRAAAPTAEELATKAEQGDAEAQYRLGQACLRGQGVQKDAAKAFALLQKAAEQGHAEATGGLGYFHANGLTVKKDLAAAAEWFRKGAEMGGAKSQLNYGQALLNGRGVKEDQAGGLKWIDKALAQNLPHAFFAKGEFFYHGTQGHPQDYAKAREYLQKAADADLAAAQNMLGSMYQEALGVTTDLAKAEELFRKSAEQGDPKGMSNLGMLLGPDGPDASKHVEALKWLLLAQRANEPQARNLLNEIFRTRPPEVVKAAQKQVAEFKPRPPTEGRPASEK